MTPGGSVTALTTAVAEVSQHHKPVKKWERYAVKYFSEVQEEEPVTSPSKQHIPPERP